MIMAETKLNIAQRISAAMNDVDYIQKEKKQGMQYTIVSHDAVTAKVRPILQKHGVVYYPRAMAIEQVGNRTQAVFDVRFENIDDREDFIDVATFGYGVDPQDKGPGKAMSYGVKYALLKVLGLETGDDPDTVQDERANFRKADAGQSSSTVSQHPPANDAPKKAEKLAGPFTSKTALWSAVRTFVHEVNGCGDSAMFEAFITSPESKALITQCERDAPQLLHGGDKMPDDYVPINALLKKMHADFELIENNPMRAG
jgi:hypothetical protein